MKDFKKNNYKKDGYNIDNLINENDLSYYKFFGFINKIIYINNNIQTSTIKKIKKNIKIFKLILICLCFLLINIFPYLKKKQISNLFFGPPTLLNIYITTHKDFINILSSPVYKILCDEKSKLKLKYILPIIETNKDNILFPKSRGYSECSKIYPIWKLYKKGTLKSKYVGINHYRRIFHFKNNIPDLDKIFKNYDAILRKRNHFKVTLWEQFKNCHMSKFLNETIDIIKEKFPEYYQSATNLFKTKWGNFCNIFIMKKEDFIKWGEFVFGVLLEFDKRYNLINDNDISNLIIKEAKNLNKKINIPYQSRLEAFLSERISIIFYQNHFKNVYEIPTLDKRFIYMNLIPKF